MTFNELYDIFQSKLKEIEPQQALPKTPKGNFITKVMLACKSESVHELRLVLYKYSDIINELPDLYKILLNFINEYDEKQLEDMGI